MSFTYQWGWKDSRARICRSLKFFIQSIVGLVTFIHKPLLIHCIFCILSHWMLIWSLQKASCAREHQEMLWVRVPFVQSMNPLKDQLTILDAQHPKDISLSFPAWKTIPQTAGGTFTPHRSVPEVCTCSSFLPPVPRHSLKPDRLPRRVRNTVFQGINRGPAALLAAKLHFGNWGFHPHQKKNYDFLQSAQSLAAQLLSE